MWKTQQDKTYQTWTSSICSAEREVKNFPITKFKSFQAAGKRRVQNERGFSSDWNWTRNVVGRREEFLENDAMICNVEPNSTR